MASVLPILFYSVLGEQILEVEHSKPLSLVNVILLANFSMSPCEAFSTCNSVATTSLRSGWNISSRQRGQRRRNALAVSRALPVRQA